MADAVLLKFEQQTSEEGERVAVVTAIKLPDKHSDEPMPVAAGSIADMAKWLRDRGYRWRTGSSGIWERAA